MQEYAHHRSERQQVVGFILVALVLTALLPAARTLAAECDDLPDPLLQVQGSRMAEEISDLGYQTWSAQPGWTLDATPLSQIPTTPTWIAAGSQPGAYFGFSVAAAGDVNGDGYSDVIIGAPYYGNGQPNEGCAVVFLGSASGLNPGPAWIAEGDQAGAYFGASVSAAGDVNSDGYGDVIVGAPYYSGALTSTGKVYVYYGSPTGLGSVPAWSAEADQAYASFGRAVSTAGDVNGDGYTDVVVGAYYYDVSLANQGRIFVYHGSAAGLGQTAAWSAAGQQANEWFGFAVAGAGDVNADGYADVLAGGFGYSGSKGAARVFHGSPGGLAATAGWLVEGTQSSARLGVAVAAAGDVNGDGFNDVIIGEERYSNAFAGAGRATVYLGSASGLLATPSWSAEGDQLYEGFGAAVSSAGDVNGDGFDEIMVGAPLYDETQMADVGKAVVFNGGSGGLSATPEWATQGTAAYSYLGYSVATAGDVNGGGLSDLLLGAYGVASLKGEAYVYHGSASEAPDEDGDGVADALDQCQHTIPGAPVDEDGCPPVVFGDADRDGDVDDIDSAAFRSCALGAAIPNDMQSCASIDKDQDEDIDWDDFGVYQRCYSGLNRLADPLCSE